MKNRDETDELRRALAEGIGAAGSLFGRLSRALEQLHASPKEVAQSWSQYDNLHQLLTRLLVMSEADMRGFHNARGEFLKSKLEDLLKILPREERKKFLEEMLAREEKEKTQAMKIVGPQ
jgi:hypothetical protein